MGLRIQTNIAAINAHKNLSTSDTNMAKSLQRLSSGFRINRAADDAAGLSISEGFRADIASFQVASRNTTEANALLQVAEGGMEQIGNMLTRLKELATQAASSNVGSAERTKINAEGNALVSEIDRIANSTKYGSTALLDGTFGASKAAGTYAYSTAAGTSGLGAYGALTHTYSAGGTGQTNGVFTANFITSLGSTLAYSGSWALSAASGTALALGNGTITESLTIAAWSTVSAAKTSYTFTNLGISLSLWTVSTSMINSATGGISTDTILQVYETGLSSLNVTGAASGTYTFSSTGTQIALGNGTITQTVTGLTIGAKNDSNNQIALSISGVGASTLNSSLAVDKLDTQAEAQSMLTTIDSAISSLTSARGTVGASMNRLSYAAANLASTIENTQAADSVIRDVDMAAEMTNFTKQQILMQAGTAMLAQANQSPQLILTLLKG